MDGPSFGKVILTGFNNFKGIAISILTVGWTKHYWLPFWFCN